MSAFKEIDLEDQSSPLPRLERDPFDLDNDSDGTETFDGSHYDDKSSRNSYQRGAYGQTMSSMSINDNDTLNDDNYLHQPLNGKGHNGKSRKSRHVLSQRRKGLNGTYRKPPRAVRIALVVAIPIMIVVVLFTLLHLSSTKESKNSAPATAPTGLTYPSGFNMKNNWGSLSPYFDTGAAFPGIDPSANEGLHEWPSQCKLTQVHVLHRHAERYPTTRAGSLMEATAKKLKNMDTPPAKALEFLKDWEYTLDTELLVSRGYGTEYASGASFWAFHGVHLFNATPSGRFLYDPVLNVYANGSARSPVVIRATSQSRIRNSAKAWAAGFFGLLGEDPMRSEESAKLLEDPNNIYKMVLQTEAPNQNSTLAGYFSCPNGNKSKYSDGGRKAREWVEVYLQDAVVRLSKLLPGLDADTEESDKHDENALNEVKAGNPEKDDTKSAGSHKSTTLTTTDVFNMQNMCAYETAAYGSSPFCSLFTEKEWRGYEYAGDLVFYGMASYGTPVGAPEGAGWLYELLARLERRQLYKEDAGWGINTTLTDNPELFPLDQPMYLDMSHDSVLVSVLTALGLDFLKHDLPTNKILAPRQFVLSRLTPFGARIFVELLHCGGDEGHAEVDGKSGNEAGKLEKRQDTTYVRLKLNNRILPLSSLKKCGANKEGLCPLDDFISSLKHALSQVDFDRNCYGVPKGYENAKDLDEGKVERLFERYYRE